MNKSINTTGEFYFGVSEEKLTAVYKEDRQILYYGIANIIIRCFHCIWRVEKEAMKWKESIMRDENI